MSTSTLPTIFSGCSSCSPQRACRWRFPAWWARRTPRGAAVRRTGCSLCLLAVLPAGAVRLPCDVLWRGSDCPVVQQPGFQLRDYGPGAHAVLHLPGISLRGYFQGRSNMVPTATSQIIEAVTKVIIGVGLASTSSRMFQRTRTVGRRWGPLWVSPSAPRWAPCTCWASSCSEPPG